MNRSTRTLLRAAAVSPAAVLIAMACGPAHADGGDGGPVGALLNGPLSNGPLTNGPLSTPLNGPLKAAAGKALNPQGLTPVNTAPKNSVISDSDPAFWMNPGAANPDGPALGAGNRSRTDAPVSIDQLGQATGLGQLDALRSLTYSGFSAKCVTSANGSLQGITTIDQNKLLDQGLGRITSLGAKSGKKRTSPTSLTSLLAPPAASSKLPMLAGITSTRTGKTVRFQSANGDPGLGFTFSKQVSDPLGGMTDEALTMDSSTGVARDLGLSHCASGNGRIAQRAADNPGAAFGAQLKQLGDRTQVFLRSFRDASGLPIPMDGRSGLQKLNEADITGLANQVDSGRKAVVPQNTAPLQEVTGLLSAADPLAPMTTGKSHETALPALPDLSGGPVTLPASDGSPQGIGSLGLPGGLTMPASVLPGLPAKLPMAAARREGLGGSALPAPGTPVLDQASSVLPTTPLAQAANNIPGVSQAASNLPGGALLHQVPGMAPPANQSSRPPKAVQDALESAMLETSALPGSVSNGTAIPGMGARRATGAPVPGSNDPLGAILGGLPGLNGFSPTGPGSSPAGLPALPLSAVNG